MWFRDMNVLAILHRRWQAQNHHEAIIWSKVIKMKMRFILYISKKWKTVQGALESQPQCAYRLFYERQQEQMSKVIWRREASRRTSTLHVPVHSFGLNSKRNHLQRTGGDHRGGRAQPGWRTFMMTCLRWILGYMRLEIWREIGLSADWCLCTALRSRSGACYYWIGNHHKIAPSCGDLNPRRIQVSKYVSNKCIAVRKVAHRYGNSHATWYHTVLPATRQSWHSRPYPSRSWYSIWRLRRDARLSRPVYTRYLEATRISPTHEISIGSVVLAQRIPVLDTETTLRATRVE